MASATRHTQAYRARDQAARQRFGNGHDPLRRPLMRGRIACQRTSLPATRPAARAAPNSTLNAARRRGPRRLASGLARLLLLAAALDRDALRDGRLGARFRPRLLHEPARNRRANRSRESLLGHGRSIASGGPARDCCLQSKLFLRPFCGRAGDWREIGVKPARLSRSAYGHAGPRLAVRSS